MQQILTGLRGLVRVLAALGVLAYGAAALVTVGDILAMLEMLENLK